MKISTIPLLSILLLTPYLLKAEQSCNEPLRIRSGVIISEELRSHLTSFAEEFCKTRGKPLVVTSGLRSAKTQARLMHRRLEQGDRLAYYQNQEAAQELLSTYRKDHSVAALHKQIEDQISRDCYISKHLFSRAADIARHDPAYPLGKSDISELYKIADERGVLIVDNEGGRKTHFHLNFPPYPTDPRRCPKVVNKKYSSAKREELILFTHYLRRDEPGYKEIYIHKDASTPLAELLKSARNDGIELYVVSGYRSYDHQKELYNREQEKMETRSVAPPGSSEHHTGYAVDLAVIYQGHHTLLTPEKNPAAFRWLETHAASYGFRLSYPEGNSSGIQYEPWHWYYEGNETVPTRSQRAPSELPSSLTNTDSGSVRASSRT